jgi:UDP-N-acetylmuramoyl-tripeptide--D-alanyl-D-alanine ligase
MNLSKKISKSVLLFLTRLIIWRYNPLIIGITGSLGKTTATKFTAALLKKGLKVMETEYEFATALTTPLTILRAKKPKQTRKIVWFLPFLFIKTLKLLFLKKDYPDCFVLELRSDVQAGRTMKLLIRSLQPKIGVITTIQPVHLTYFKSINRIAQAKKALIESLPSQGLALLNYDDPLVRKMAKFSQAPVLFYGLSPQAALRAEKIKLGSTGLKFEIHYQDKVIPVQAPHLINRAYVYPLLIAGGLALICAHLSPKDIAASITKLKPIEGRGNLVPGIKKTILINDAFNATPCSVLSAIDGLMSVFSDRRKIAVLGDMLQMEHLTKKGHKKIGQKIAQTKPDLLITVGQNASIIAQEAIRLGYPLEQVFRVLNFKEALALLKTKIKEDDVVLFKGSHAMKLYKIVEGLRVKQGLYQLKNT